jgi:hypothetical protein
VLIAQQLTELAGNLAGLERDLLVGEPPRAPAERRELPIAAVVAPPGLPGRVVAVAVGLDDQRRCSSQTKSRARPAISWLAAGLGSFALRTSAKNRRSRWLRALS